MPIWTSIIHPVTRFFRRRRAQEILRILPNFNSLAVLDLGGSRHFWEKMDGILNPHNLTILNIADDGAAVSSDETSNVNVVLYDGRHVPYPDKYFDIVICNSVIEHVPPAARQGLMREVERVGAAYFVQTPAFWFPLEPHFLMPFMHWMPRRLARHLALVSTYRWMTGASAKETLSYFDEIQILKKSEFRSYLRNASISTERLLGVPKSYTLYRVNR